MCMVVALPAGTVTLADIVPALTVPLASAVGATVGVGAVLPEDGLRLPLEPLPGFLVPLPLVPPLAPPEAGGLITVTVAVLEALAYALEHLMLYVRVPAGLPTFTARLPLKALLPLHDPLAVQALALPEDHESVTVALVVTVVDAALFTFRLALGLGQAGRLAVAT